MTMLLPPQQVVKKGSWVRGPAEGLYYWHPEGGGLARPAYVFLGGDGTVQFGGGGGGGGVVMIKPNGTPDRAIVAVVEEAALGRLPWNGKLGDYRLLL